MSYKAVDALQVLPSIDPKMLDLHIPILPLHEPSLVLLAEPKRLQRVSSARYVRRCRYVLDTVQAPNNYFDAN